MTNQTIAALRLRSQRITGERCCSPAEAVRWMGAMQAQDYGQALWAIGLRTHRAILADVERAIAEHQIVLTWPMRGTLHAVPAADARWMLQLSAARTVAADSRRLAQLGLAAGDIERCKALFADALAGGKQLTRPAMMALLADAGINPQGQRGYHILWHAAQAGVICLGPRAGKQQTFVLLDEWVPNAVVLSRQEALAELAARFFRSHGPATVHDFSRWAGLTLTEARQGLDAAKPALASELRDTVEYWMDEALAGDAAPDTADCHLLPGFDEYLLGYKDRGDVLAAEHAEKVVPGKNGIFLPTIVAGGQVVGTWKRTVKRGDLHIALSHFGAPDGTDEAIAGAAQRYADFMALPLARVAPA